jgi:hypothetical protein
LFNGIGRGVNPGGIDDPEPETIQIAGHFDGIAGRARIGRDDGTVTANQGIQQTGFPNIGTADYGRGQALSRHPPTGERRQQTGHIVPSLYETFDEAACGDELDILVGEINTGLKIHADLQELFSQVAQLTGQRPLQLRHGGAVAGHGARRDEINNSLSLGEIESSVQKGAFGKLAGFGDTGSLRQYRVKHPLGNEYTTVTTDLSDVLAGVRARLPHDAEECLIQSLSTGIDHEAMINPMRLHLLQRSAARGHEHPLGDANRRWPAHPYDTNAPCSWWSSNRRYGIWRFHALCHPYSVALVAAVCI